MATLAGFSKIILVWVTLFAAARFAYYFMSKRNPFGSDFEKSLAKFGISTAFCIILIFLSYVYISTLTRSSVSISLDEPIEVRVQQLLSNQQQIKMELDATREVLSFLLLAIAFYLLSALGILHEWRNERKKLSQPSVKLRPLGLDLE